MIQREYYSGVNYNVVFYLTRFDSCDNQLWTRKIKTPLDHYRIGEMEFSSESTIILGLFKRQEAVAIIELDLLGQIIEAHTLEFTVDGCSELSNIYIEFSSDHDYIICGVANCSENTSYFIKVDDFNKINGRTFKEYNFDSHIRYLDNKDLLGQVGQYYFRMTEFDSVQWVTKMTYKEEYGYYLSCQPLIDGKYAYLAVEKVASIGFRGAEIFLLKLDLDNGEEIWKSDIMRLDYPMKIFDGNNNAVIITGKSDEGNALLGFDRASGDQVENTILDIQEYKVKGESAVLSQHDQILVYENAQTYQYEEPQLFLVLNPQLDHCIDSYSTQLETNEEVVEFNQVDEDIFVEEFTGRIEPLVDIEESYLDTVFYTQLCEQIIIEEMELDTTLECNEVFNFDNFDESWNFEWSDGPNSASRTFKEPGRYSCVISNCRHEIITDLLINTGDCNYEIYLPNVLLLSDEKESKLEITSNYDWEYYEISIYDRWGNLVFMNQNPDISWNPVNINSGVYVVKVTYKLQGMEKIAEQYCNITVLK